MKFNLEIELGNDAMQTTAGIGRALIKYGQRFRNESDGPAIRDGGKIMDENGNSVGKWEIADDAPTDYQRALKDYAEAKENNPSIDFAKPEPATIDPAHLENARLEIALLVRFITCGPDRYTAKNPYQRPEVKRALRYLSNKPSDPTHVNYDAAEQVIAAAGMEIPYLDNKPLPIDDIAKPFTVYERMDDATAKAKPEEYIVAFESLATGCTAYATTLDPATLGERKKPVVIMRKPETTGK
jgi:hypothetical protein